MNKLIEENEKNINESKANFKDSTTQGSDDEDNNSSSENSNLKETETGVYLDMTESINKTTKINKTEKYDEELPLVYIFLIISSLLCILGLFIYKFVIDYQSVPDLETSHSK